MAVLQPIIDLAAVCYAHGIRHVVLSPGSRSAALTLAFARHGGFELHVVMDERSGGFIALGIAQQIGIPVVLICTSGSAAYNFAPAVSEAFFQQVPLLILTADRPREWTHQYDGQTIYQTDIYGKHVKRSFEFGADYADKDVIWSINRTTNDSVNIACAIPQGPVHINVPIREPFYPSDGEVFAQSDKIRIIKRTQADPVLPNEIWHELMDEWDDARKIMIVGGQHPKSERLNNVLTRISEELDIPVIGDSITNLSGSENFISHHDIFLPVDTEISKKLAPDLLITYGLSLISKELKGFLRKNPGMVHWHVGEDTIWTDPLKSVTRQIPVSAEYFFENIFEKIDYQLFVQNSDPENDSNYLADWLALDRLGSANLSAYLEYITVLNDLTAIYRVISSLSHGDQLHVGNSMAIRYVNALGKTSNLSGVFCNRGTSGIDGSVSTAIGAALVNDKPTYLIIGDVSFLYDRNGLLITPLPDNLKIVVINNGGGNIFRVIDGPAKLPELESYFETRHHFSALRTAQDSGIYYSCVRSKEILDAELNAFRERQGPSLLEIFTDPEENEKVWNGLKLLSPH